MSTKIYDAFVYKGNIENLMKWLFQKKEQYKELKKEEIARLFRGQKKIQKENYFMIAELIEKSVKKQINAVTNYQAQAVIYFYKKKIYIKFFSVPSKLLPKDKKFIDFHYQNSTDKPDNISNKEWAYRERTWDKILKHNTTFGEDGLTFEFTPPYFGFEIARYIINGN